MIEHKKTKLIGMHETAVTTMAADYHTLATVGAGTCHVVAMYNPSHHIVALSHVDEQTSIRSLNAAHLTVSRQAQDPVHVAVMGGRPNSIHLGNELIEYLSSLPHVSIKDLRNSQQNSILGVAIDSRNGAISCHHVVPGKIIQNEFDPKTLIDLDPAAVTRSMPWILAARGAQTALALAYDGTLEKEMLPLAPREKPLGRKIIFDKLVT